MVNTRNFLFWGGVALIVIAGAMFFVFPVSDTYGFWMRHMQFPIDMIWIDENFRIVHIEKSVTPDSFPETFTPDAPARFVLETSAGFAKKNGILIGDIAHVSDF